MLVSAALLGSVVFCLAAGAFYLAVRPAQTPSSPPPAPPASQDGSSTGKAAQQAPPPTADARRMISADPLIFSIPGAGPGKQGSGAPGASVNPRSVIARLQKSVRANPKDVASRVALLTQLDSAGLRSEAEDVVREALQGGQRDPRLYHALGMLYMRHKFYDAAAEVFRCQVEVAPNDAQGNLRLAECYSLVGERERARAYFEKALKLKPDEPDAYMGLAFLNSSTHRAQYAIKYLRRYISLSKEPGQGYLLLSRIYVNQDRHADAIDAGLKGVAHMPANPEMWYNLGQAYFYSRGDKLLDRAEDAFRRVVQLAPDNGHGHFELGRLLARLDRVPEAVAEYGEAVRCEPLNGKYHYQYGRALLQAKRRDEGSRELARARELLPLNQRESHLRDRLSAVPGDAKAWCELGVIYQSYGDQRLARACADRALEVSPGFAPARTLRQALASTAPPAQRQ